MSASHSRIIAKAVLFVSMPVVFCCTAAPAAEDSEPTGPVLRAVSVVDEDEDPRAAGRTAAELLLEEFGGTPPEVVLLSECFEGEEAKKAMLEGLKEVLPAESIFGLATYGSFTQEGCTDYDAVGLLGIGGKIEVKTAVVENTKTSKLVYQEHQAEIDRRLKEAGQALAEQLGPSADETSEGSLLICLADAHSPKNAPLVEGIQKVTGADYPLTGGSANKNAGQTFVYYQGRMLTDGVVAVHLRGDFKTALVGRQAKTNETVILSAKEGMATALEIAGKTSAKPRIAGVLAFNCAGRRSKLENYEEELAAMQTSLGKSLPLFGCYCAGEIGPVDVDTQKKGRIGGDGWHVMFTVIYK